MMHFEDDKCKICKNNYPSRTNKLRSNEYQILTHKQNAQLVQMGKSYQLEPSFLKSQNFSPFWEKVQVMMFNKFWIWAT
jgi:hypothetical protein